ncbi:hypothetical protein [Rhizobium leguminosarum]|uniref:hypothetical protein n=1 Tax=Rhizobium leguminosarum TaxID=384 RepID=UPI003F96C995
MKRRSHFTLFWLLVAGAAVTAGTARADFLLIKTISTQGAPVSSDVQMSVNNAAWANIEGEATNDGTKVFMSKCDASVRFKAFKRDRMGFYTRSNPDDIRFCQTPEVVFNDYVPTAVGQMISPGSLGDPKAWESIFGSDKETATKYADAFRTALDKGDYGFIAIATTELAASLRKAGSEKAAYPFEVISMQSTLNGVLQAQGLHPDDYTVLDPTPGSSRLALTPKAQDQLIEYQKTLGIPATSKELGKTGWATMKSLPGGQDVKAVEWKLPTQAATHFDQSVFAPPPM